jgi:hypothetical protein
MLRSLRDAGLGTWLFGHTTGYSGRVGAEGWRNPTTVRRRLIGGPDSLRPLGGFRGCTQLVVPTKRS